MATRREMMIGAAAALWAGQARAAPTIAQEPAFGGAWRLVGPGADDPEIAATVRRVVARIDAAMSPWRPESPLSRFNRATTAGWQPMPAELCQVAAEALAAARGTDGAFDPTLGPATRRFGFGPIEGAAGLIDAIEVRPDALRKDRPDATLDLCGIAKGHALDEAATALQRAGLTDALLEVGGEVRAWGTHPDGRPWRVGVERPGGGAAAVVAPRGRALASSGHLPNGLRAGIALSHVIDPRTRRPAAGGIATVSVLADTGAGADAWATAFLARGAEGPALARRAGVTAMFIGNELAGPDRILTGDFADHLLA